MISPKLYKSSRVYDFFLKFLGFERSIDRFLQSLELDCASNCRILDSGCGTGVLGLHFLERFPASKLRATDIEPNFLQTTLANAQLRGIDRKRVEVGIADISRPQQMTSLDGVSLTLKDATFDLICVGAVVGYADDTEASIRRLLGLLSPGGYLINMEMNQGFAGRFVSNRYHYHNIPLGRMQDLIRREGCQVSVTELSMRHLPAKLTRTAIVARKSPNGEGSRLRQ